MTGEKWQTAWQIYRTVREIPPGKRQAFLDSASSDPEVISEVLSLLEQSEGPAAEPTSPDALPAIGSQVSRYLLLAHLGRGGMGTVYAARDQELGRIVALKFLSPDAMTNRSVERLIREAKTLSSLNHPNIVTIYDVIQSGSTFAIAMELIEGQALRQLCGTPLAAGRVIRLGLQMAQALATAHAHGIVHRDIKPENIFIRTDGYVKLLDFGLARPVTADQSNSFHGLPAGTLRYMSPEQARGGSVTPASDVFSLGLVLYELATGQHPFPAGSPLETAHAITTQALTPPSMLNRSIPAPLDRLIVSTLVKDRALRPSAGELVEKLQILLAPDRSGSTETGLQPGMSVPRLVWLFVVTASVISLLALGWLQWNRRESAAFADLTIQPLTSQTGWEEYPAVSPDGQSVAFTWSAQFDGPRQIFIKQLHSNVLSELSTSTLEEGTGKIAQLAWSPDGRRIAFKRGSGEFGKPGIIDSLSSTGGNEKKLADLSNTNFSSAIDWSPDGTQLAFSDTPPESSQLAIYLLDLRTGEKRKLTSPPPQIWGDWDPKFSPDGSMLAFKRVTDFMADNLYLIPAAGGVPRRVTTGTGGIWGHTWTADGQYLVASCQRGGTVFGLWLFPPATPAQAIRLIQGGVDSITPASARRTGRIAWVNQIEDLNIYRVAASGTAQPIKFIASTLRDQGARYSRDGRIAFISDRTGNREIWLANSDGSHQVQATELNRPWIGNLQWSPDGKRLAFDSRLNGHPSVFTIECDPVAMHCGQPRQITSGVSALFPNWSADGNFLYFASDRTGGRWEIWKQPVSGGPPTQVTRKGGYTSQESSDGHWLYFSKASTSSIWRIPLSHPGGSPFPEEEIVIGSPFQVQPEGGWTLAGGEIFFINHSVQAQSTNIYAYRIATRKIRMVLTLPYIFVDRNDISLSVSPDAHWILYSQLDRAASNIMVADTTR